MRTFALFGVYNFGFFEIYGVSARTRGRGQFFVRTSFMYCPQGVFYVLLRRGQAPHLGGLAPLLLTVHITNIQLNYFF